MKKLLIILALTTMATSPVAPTGCATTVSTKYGTVTYTLPVGKEKGYSK